MTWSVRGQTTGVSISPDGTQVSAVADQRLTVWNVAGSTPRVLRTGPAAAAVFLADGKLGVLSIDRKYTSSRVS